MPRSLRCSTTSKPAWRNSAAIASASFAGLGSLVTFLYAELPMTRATRLSTAASAGDNDASARMTVTIDARMRADNPMAHRPVVRLLIADYHKFCRGLATAGWLGRRADWPGEDSVSHEFGCVSGSD